MKICTKYSSNPVDPVEISKFLSAVGLGKMAWDCCWLA